ncbi:MAG TPA: hypothetical protein VGO93_01525 [Candidatus Xenobia bacterium]
MTPRARFLRMSGLISLASVLMVVAVAMIASFTLAGLSVTHIRFLSREVNRVEARNLAESAIGMAVDQIMQSAAPTPIGGVTTYVIEPGYQSMDSNVVAMPNSWPGLPPGSAGMLTFAAPSLGQTAVVKTQSGRSYAIPYSTSDVDTTAAGGPSAPKAGYPAQLPGGCSKLGGPFTSVPANQVRLIGTGVCGNEEVCIMVVLYWPPLHNAMMTSGKIVSGGGGLTVAGVAKSCPKMCPKSLACPKNRGMSGMFSNSPCQAYAIQFTSCAKICGDVKAVGKIGICTNTFAASGCVLSCQVPQAIPTVNVDGMIRAAFAFPCSHAMSTKPTVIQHPTGCACRCCLSSIGTSCNYYLAVGCVTFPHGLHLNGTSLIVKSGCVPGCGQPHTLKSVCCACVCPYPTGTSSAYPSGYPCCLKCPNKYPLPQYHCHHCIWCPPVTSWKFEKGHVTVDCGVTGYGAVITSSGIDVTGASCLSAMGSGKSIALVSQGDVNISAGCKGKCWPCPGCSHNYFQGLIYTGGCFTANGITLVGAFVANSSVAAKGNMNLGHCSPVHMILVPGFATVLITQQGVCCSLGVVQAHCQGCYFLAAITIGLLGNPSKCPGGAWHGCCNPPFSKCSGNYKIKVCAQPVCGKKCVRIKICGTCAGLYNPCCLCGNCAVVGKVKQVDCAVQGYASYWCYSGWVPVPKKKKLFCQAAFTHSKAAMHEHIQAILNAHKLVVVKPPTNHTSQFGFCANNFYSEADQLRVLIWEPILPP